MPDRPDCFKEGKYLTSQNGKRSTSRRTKWPRKAQLSYRVSGQASIEKIFLVKPSIASRFLIKPSSPRSYLVKRRQQIDET